MNYLFICEFNKKIGLGHISRCKNLATFLLREKNQCFFLSNNSKKNDLKKFNISKKIDFTNVNWNYKKNYKKFINYCLIKKIDFIVIDNYEINYEWCKNINNCGFKIIQFADFKSKKYHSSILINPNSNNKFNNKMKNSIQFTGSKFSFIENEFMLNKTKKLKLDNNNLRILIYLGSNFSKKILLGILYKLKKFKKNINQISVITNEKYLLKDSAIKFLKFQKIRKLVSTIDKNDIIITAGGTFLIKCLIRNKLILSIETHGNQKENLFSLSKQNQIFLIKKNLKNLNYKNVINFFKIKKKNKLKISDLNIAQKEFYKANIEIYQKNIKLIPKNKNQIMLIYNIQNEDGSRKFALNANKITKREHVNWFDQLIQNQNHYHFVIKKGITNVGILSFKLTKGYYYISIIIRKKYRGNNLAYTALYQGINILNLNKKPFVSFVKKENLSSIKLFKKLHFKKNSKKRKLVIV